VANGKHSYIKVDTRIEELVLRLKKLTIKFHERIKRSDKTTSLRDKKIIVAYVDSLKLNKFYGLIKIHKAKLDIRPIISNTNGLLSGISKWLDYHLQRHIRRLHSYLKDSDQLIVDLKNVEHDASYRVITYDVVSMYTSIETNKALKLISRYLPRNELNACILDGLRIVMTNNFFEFDGKVWFQVTGTAMGTATAPAYAVLFLGIAEELIFRKFKRHFVINRRFIDDGFMV